MDQGPFCGATDCSCFGLRMSFLTGFKSRVALSPALFQIKIKKKKKFETNTIYKLVLASSGLKFHFHTMYILIELLTKCFSIRCPQCQLGGGSPRWYPLNWGGAPGGGRGAPGGTPPLQQKNGQKKGQSFGQKMDKILDTKLDKHFGHKIGQTFWKLLEVGGRGRYASCGHAGGLSCFKDALKLQVRIIILIATDGFAIAAI